MPFAALEDWVMEAVRQVPALAVLVFVVIQFLRHISEADRRCSTNSMTAAASVSELVTNMQNFQNDITRRSEAQMAKVQESLDKNTEALGRNTEALAYQARAARFDRQNKNQQNPPGGHT